MSFGGSATTISAFEFMYAATVDTSSDAKNPNDIQTCDCLGLNNLIVMILNSVIISNLP